MMARRLIRVILTVILVVPSLYLPTFSKGVDTHPSTSTSPDPFGRGTDKASTSSDATPSPMTTARAEHTATLLPNGKVLVAGGIDASGHAVSSAELYDPTTGIWTATGNMTMARWQHTATLLPDGKVLVVGGIDTTASNTTVLSSAELYDPHTGRWTATGSMHNARGSHAAALLSTGRVLVIGGWCNKEQTCILNSAELYDPHTGLWTPTRAMETARAVLTATPLADGRVLVAGGDSTCCQYTAFASAELYDPRIGSWSPTSSMHTSRYAHTATRLPNGSVLVVGGSSGVSPNQASVSNAEIYNPSSGTWAETSAMNKPRTALTATLLPDGRVLATGGDNCSASTSCTPLASTELYNPGTGMWASATDMSVARWAHTATLLPNGQVLITGGNTLSCCAWSGMSSAELYPRSSSGSTPALGLVDWWKADGDAKDAVGPNDGTPSNISFASGAIDQAFSFNGRDSSINFGPRAGNFGTGDFTIQFWAKVHGNSEGILGKRPICDHSNFWDIRGGAGGLQLEVDQSGTNYFYLQTHHPLDDGAFHLITFVRHGTTVSAYSDAHLDASKSSPHPTDMDNNSSLVAGHSTCTGADKTGWLNGQLDEIKLYGRALSDKEISGDAHGTSSGYDDKTSSLYGVAGGFDQVSEAEARRRIKLVAKTLHGSYIRFGTTMSCASTTPSASWWNDAKGNPSHTYAYALIKDAIDFGLNPVVWILPHYESHNVIIQHKPVGYNFLCNPLDGHKIRMTPSSWASEIYHFIEQMPRWPARTHARTLYLEIGNEVNVQGVTALTTDNLHGPTYWSQYPDAFAAAARAASDAFQKFGYRFPWLRNYRIVTAGMYAPTAKATCLQTAPAPVLTEPNINMVGRAISQAREAGVRDAHLGVAIHPYHYNTYYIKAPPLATPSEAILYTPYYFAHYYAPTTPSLGRVFPNDYAGPCGDLSEMLKTWTTRFHGLPLLFTEMGVADHGPSPDQSIVSLLKQPRFLPSDAAKLEGAYLVDLFTYINDYNMDTYGSNDPGDTPIRIFWYPLTDADIPLGLYTHGVRSKAVSIVCYSSDHTHTYTVSTLDEAFARTAHDRCYGR